MPLGRFSRDWSRHESICRLGEETDTIDLPSLGPRHDFSHVSAPMATPTMGIMLLTLVFAGASSCHYVYLPICMDYHSHILLLDQVVVYDSGSLVGKGDAKIQGTRSCSMFPWTMMYRF